MVTVYVYDKSLKDIKGLYPGSRVELCQELSEVAIQDQQNNPPVRFPEKTTHRFPHFLRWHTASVGGRPVLGGPGCETATWEVSESPD